MPIQRIDLRAYRESIASRLAAAAGSVAIPALLGFEAAGRRWLLELPAAGEVLQLPPLLPVPRTRPWFAGLANVHGELQHVVDFAAFCGGPPTPRGDPARLLRIGAPLASDVALLVARVHGLRRADTLCAAAAATPPPPWCAETLMDNQGEHWTRLDPERLLADPALRDAALPGEDS
jgi:twitching motility protein PilI